MSRRPRLFPAVLAGLAVLTVAALAGCAPDAADTAALPTPAASSASPTPTATASPTPTPTAEATPEIPTDCRALLSDAVLAQLDGVPLNDPAFAPTGVQSDGSLVCVWRDPAADTTGLSTKISAMPSGAALDMLNALVSSDGYTCFTPDGGTRCEKTWVNQQYPVNDGRTLFYRSGLLIDTAYSNLAPSGYTDSVVAHVYG
ncbi:hypothetical protein [Microbacterium sp. P04]|uniref:hypothetical protein n=1 Tax=Microbacterium sp. P04 TaxID=3366947 RepID=UPI0037454800